MLPFMFMYLVLIYSTPYTWPLGLNKHSHMVMNHRIIFMFHECFFNYKQALTIEAMGSHFGKNISKFCMAFLELSKLPSPSS